MCLVCTYGFVYLLHVFFIGLFHQAILQSGTDLTPWAINFPAMKPIQFTIATAKKLNCTRNTNQEMVDCLREVESEKLRQNAVSSMPVCTLLSVTFCLFFYKHCILCFFQFLLWYSFVFVNVYVNQIVIV